MRKVNRVKHVEPKNCELPPDALTCRPGTCARLLGISRPAVYDLERRGLIRVMRLKGEGAKRGITLIDVASIRALVQSGAASSN